MFLSTPASLPFSQPTTAADPGACPSPESASRVASATWPFQRGYGYNLYSGPNTGGQGYRTERELLWAASKWTLVRSRATGFEVGGYIVRDNRTGRYHFAWVDGRRLSSDDPRNPGGVSLPKPHWVQRDGYRIVGDVHNHPYPAKIEGPSVTDVDHGQRRTRELKLGAGIDYHSYVVANDGDVYRYWGHGDPAQAAVQFVFDVDTDTQEDKPASVITAPIDFRPPKNEAHPDP
jgi:hypothetical protein